MVQNGILIETIITSVSVFIVFSAGVNVWLQTLRSYSLHVQQQLKKQYRQNTSYLKG